jgi:hypothetical protein
MIKKIIELLNQLFVTYTIWFQNGTNILWKKYHGENKLQFDEMVSAL